MKIAKNKFVWIKYKNNSYDDLKQRIIEHTFRTNSSFKKINNEFCYKNWENEFISFAFAERELDFDIDKHIFCKSIILKIIKNAMIQLSRRYTKEEIQYSSDINDNFLIKHIELWLNKLYYRKKINPVDISCYITFKILTHHYFTNDNKRISIIFLTEILEYFHLFLSYSNVSANETEFQNRWYVLFTNYVKKHEQKNYNPDDLYDDFKQSILDGIFLNLKNIKNKLI